MRILLEQRSPEWIEFRKTHVGASDAPIIMRESPWKTPIDLWEEKLGMKETKFNKAMQHGIDNEDFARADFMKAMMVEVEPAVIQSDEYPFMIASLDGISDDWKVAVEIKCPYSISSHLIAASGEVPRHYWIQIQHQMSVAGLDKLYYCSFFNDESEIIEVQRDDKYILKLIEEEKKFYECLLEKKQPELTSRDYEVIAGEEFFDISEKYKDVLENIAYLEDEKELLKKELIAMAKNRNVKGNGLSIKKCQSKGRINFSKMPFDLKEQIEPFRGKDIQSWRINSY